MSATVQQVAEVYLSPITDSGDDSLYAVGARLAAAFALSGLGVLAFLLLWRQISWWREPQWVKNAPTVPSPNLWARIQGTTIEFVQQGKICRTFMHPDQPDVLRLNNGVAGGMFRDFIFVKDPKIAREVLEESNTRKPERGYRAFRRLTGYKGSPDFLSSVSHKDDLYSRTRVKAYEVLMRRCLENFDTQFVETVDRFIDRISKSSTFAVVDEMHLIATSLITRIAFNEDSEEFDRNLFESAVWIINDMINRPMNCSLTFMDDLPTPTNWQLKRRQKTLVDTIETMIQHKKDAPGDDLISELLKDEKNTDDDLLGILSIFFFAGFDTTSNTMSMCLYHLANNPEVQERCRRDVFDVLGKEGKPVMSKIFHMQYLIAVIKETLRMFPTVPMVTREVTEHHPDGVCPRFKEPSTFGVTLNFFGLHYNPAAWNKPEEFLPERWLDPSIDADRDASQRLYCPFAIGKRSCLGRQFAYIEMLTVIASILQKYRVFPKKGAPDVKISEGGTLVVDHDMELGLEPYVEAKAMSAMLKASANRNKNEKSYTVEEVAKHHSKDDLWMILDNGVYDITEYVAGEQGGHPGGDRNPRGLRRHRRYCRVRLHRAPQLRPEDALSVPHRKGCRPAPFAPKGGPGKAHSRRRRRPRQAPHDASGGQYVQGGPCADAQLQVTRWRLFAPSGASSAAGRERRERPRRPRRSFHDTISQSTFPHAVNASLAFPIRSDPPT